MVDGTNTEKHLSIMLFPATTPKNILSQKYGSALVYHTEIQLGCAKDMHKLKWANYNSFEESDSICFDNFLSTYFNVMLSEKLSNQIIVVPSSKETEFSIVSFFK